MGKYLDSFYKKLALALDPHGKVSEFCRNTKISRSAVDAWLKRENSPTIETLEVVATALGVQPWELLKPEGASETLDPLLAKVVARWSELNEAEKGTVVSVTNALADKFIADPQAKNLVSKQKKSSA